MNWPEVYLHMKAGTDLDEAHQREVAAALEKYPFFAMGRMMMAKLATKLGDPRAQQLRFLGSLYAPSRQLYAFFLEERLRPRVPPPPRLTSSGRESQTPPARSEKKEETPASSDEPGPESMPYSEAFLPALQGWLAARRILYRNLGRRLYAQLVYEFPPPSPSPLVEESHSAPLPSSISLPSASTQPEEAVAMKEPIPSPSAPQVAPTSEAPAIASAPMEPPVSPLIADMPLLREKSPPPQSAPLLRETSVGASRHPLAFTPRGVSMLLQFELATSGRESAESVRAPLSPILQEESSEVIAIVEETSTLSEVISEEASSPAPIESFIPEAELREQFHRPYVPLEEVSASVHLSEQLPSAPAPPVEAQTKGPPSEKIDEQGLREQFHRPYVPLEVPESPVRLASQETSAPSSSSPIDMTSNSPIRSFIPLEIDVGASIHLPVPEPEATEPLPPIMPPTEPPPPPKSPESPPSPAWQSFLAELQKELPLPGQMPAPASKELEGLRREFIKRLLAQRLIQPHSPPSPAEPNLIDMLIQKLEAFQPQASPSTERELPELTIPSWESTPTAPRVYTETMAKLYWAQGDLAKAIEVYETLIQKNPQNAEHYREQIRRIRAGEAP
ncbi:MAG: tetratricopeptide repeat protein [Bacteroidia bacterium]|nr:tetratricopeptide repeat protein [Bacteroidia bacterium]MDW8057083.1 tetratricopeptide repeat protein [Bacteroidia bacterium]